VIVVSLDPSGNYQVPVTYNWNLTIERQLTRDLMFRISYVGSHSSHIATSEQLNPAVFTPGSTLSTDQRRIFKNFSGITLDSQSVNEHYDSLQLGVEKRLSHGLTVLANYTYGNAMDNLPFAQSVTGPGPNAPGTVYPWYFPKADALDYGRSDFDRRHRFVLSYVYMLPSLKGANNVVRGIFGNWQVTGLLQTQTGDPLTVKSGKDQSNTGIGGDRAMLVGPALGPGACGASAPCVPYLIPGSFAQPPAASVANPYILSFGNFGKGAVSGPGLVGWDVGLFRNIPIRERFSFQLRGEFFNVINRANFADPVATLSSGGFGSITSAADPRIGQLALKLIF
jgi:hypothetical protein